MTNYTILVTAFGALNDERLGNLKWHVDNGTPVFCGEGSAFANSEGHF